MDAKQGSGNYNGNIRATHTGFRYGPQSRRSAQGLGAENWDGSTFSSLAVMQTNDIYILSKQHAEESCKGKLLVCFQFFTFLDVRRDDKLSFYFFDN